MVGLGNAKDNRTGFLFKYLLSGVIYVTNDRTALQKAISGVILIDPGDGTLKRKH